MCKTLIQFPKMPDFSGSIKGLDFTSSSSLSSHSFIKHVVAKTVVVETIVVVKAAVT